MIVETDGYRFDFTNALDAYVFDEKDSTKETHHRLPMKAVDIVAEFEKGYVFVEPKNMHDTEQYDARADGSENRARRAAA